MKCTKHQYDILKLTTMITIPAICIVLNVIGILFGCLYVMIFITAVLLFIDLLLGFVLTSAKNGYSGDGVLFVDDSQEHKTIIRLQLDDDMYDVFDSKKSIDLKVKKAILE